MANQNGGKTPQELCEEIACCKNICDYFNGGLSSKNDKPPCREIIESQLCLESNCKKLINEDNYKKTLEVIINNMREEFSENFQIPEPWVGHIDKAPLLFLSSNPSISDDEKDYPRFGKIKKNIESSSLSFVFKDDPLKLIDFYNKRFEANPKKENKWPSYWNSVYKAALYLYDKNDKKDNGSIKCGCHYALSEVVHCKSKSETGVPQALNECSEKYLEELLDISPAKVVVVYGVNAKSSPLLSNLIEKDLGKIKCKDVCLVKYKYKYKNGKCEDRYFIFAPHPNAKGYHNLAHYLDIIKNKKEPLFEEIQQCFNSRL